MLQAYDSDQDLYSIAGNWVYSRSLEQRRGVCGPPPSTSSRQEVIMNVWFKRLWGEEGQDIAEYAVMLAVILAIVVGTIRLIGSSANNVFSSVASSIQ